MLSSQKNSSPSQCQTYSSAISKKNASTCLSTLMRTSRRMSEVQASTMRLSTMSIPQLSTAVQALGRLITTAMIASFTTIALLKFLRLLQTSRLERVGSQDTQTTLNRLIDCLSQIRQAPKQKLIAGIILMKKKASSLSIGEVSFSSPSDPCLKLSPYQERLTRFPASIFLTHPRTTKSCSNILRHI